MRVSSLISSKHFRGLLKLASVVIELLPLNALNDDSTIRSNDPRMDDVLELETIEGENKFDWIGALLMIETSFSFSS